MSDPFTTRIEAMKQRAERILASPACPDYEACNAARDLLALIPVVEAAPRFLAEFDAVMNDADLYPDEAAEARQAFANALAALKSREAP